MSLALLWLLLLWLLLQLLLQVQVGMLHLRSQKTGMPAPAMSWL